MHLAIHNIYNILGITCRLDVIELLEKRVKSRFSHRQIFLFPNNDNCEDNINSHTRLFVNLLSLPFEIRKLKKIHPQKSINLQTDSFSESEDNDKSSDDFDIPYDILLKCKSSTKEFRHLDPIFVSFWNEHVKNLSNNKCVQNCIQRLYDMDVNEQVFKNFMVCFVLYLHFIIFTV